MLADDVRQHEQTLRPPLFPLQGTFQPLPSSRLPVFDVDVVMNSVDGDAATQRYRPLLWTTSRPADFTWYGARERNQTEVPLLRLPDELLHLILKNTNYATQLVLRQTCHRLERFFVSKQPPVDQSINGPQGCMDGRMVMSLHALPPHNPRITEPFLECLRRGFQGVCDPCTLLRRHFAELLQAHQRADALYRYLTTSTEKTQPGLIRIPYTWVQQYLDDPAVDAPKILFCGHCREKHSDTLFSHAQRNGLPDPENPAGPLQIVPARKRICIGAEGFLRMCQHTSAGPLRDAIGPGLGRRLLACPESTEAHYAPVLQRLHNGLLLLSEPTSTLAKGAPPLLVITGKREVLQCWAIPILQLTYGDGVPPPRQDLADGLGRNYDHLQDLMCGHIAPNDPRLLLPFAPGQCGCYDDGPGEENWHYPDSSGSHHNHNHNAFCCRCRCEEEDWYGSDSDQPFHHGFLTYDQPATDFFNNNVDGDAATVEAVVRAVHYMLQETAHRYACPHCPAVYTWAMDHATQTIFFQCASKTAPLAKPTDRQWLQLLDPQWRMAHTGNDMMFRTHCPDRYCRTTIQWADQVE